MDSLKEELEDEVEVEEATVTSEAAIDASEDPDMASEVTQKRSPSLPLTKRKNTFERKLSLDASAFRPNIQQQEKKRHSDFIREVLSSIHTLVGLGFVYPASSSHYLDPIL